VCIGTPQKRSDKTENLVKNDLRPKNSGDMVKYRKGEKGWEMGRGGRQVRRGSVPYPFSRPSYSAMRYELTGSTNTVHLCPKMLGILTLWSQPEMVFFEDTYLV
jgi:hypothetical protein